MQRRGGLQTELHCNLFTQHYVPMTSCIYMQVRVEAGLVRQYNELGAAGLLAEGLVWEGEAVHRLSQ